MGPDLFFPVGESSDQALHQTAEATSVCQECPVRLHCLVWALVMNPEFGIWGGTSPRERRVIRRDRRLRRQAKARQWTQPDGRILASSTVSGDMEASIEMGTTETVA